MATRRLENLELSGGLLRAQTLFRVRSSIFLGGMKGRVADVVAPRSCSTSIAPFLAFSRAVVETKYQAEPMGSASGLTWALHPWNAAARRGDREWRRQ